MGLDDERVLSGMLTLSVETADELEGAGAVVVPGAEGAGAEGAGADGADGAEGAGGAGDSGVGVAGGAGALPGGVT